MVIYISTRALFIEAVSHIYQATASTEQTFNKHTCVIFTNSPKLLHFTRMESLKLWCRTMFIAETKGQAPRRAVLQLGFDLEDDAATRRLPYS